MYDFYLQLFGVREVAEQELHFLFTAVRELASKHPRVRLFALFCGIPMTQTKSTAHGFFDLDAHLAVVGVTVAAVAPGEAVVVDDGAPDDAFSGPVLAREREAAMERELFSEKALSFYFKVRERSTEHAAVVAGCFETFCEILCSVVVGPR